MSDYQLQQAIHYAINSGVQNHPLLMTLNSRIDVLEKRLAAMESCCVCVKVNKPLELTQS